MILHLERKKYPRIRKGDVLQYLVTGKEMKLLDQNTSQVFHVPELVLMEQAAVAFVEKLFLLEKEKERKIHSVCILCGCGNNGADGMAIARLLPQKGYAIQLVLAGESFGGKKSSSYLVQKEICSAYQIPMYDILPKEETDLLIDALFGIGLSREVSGEYKKILSEANQRNGWKVSVDISSGISSETGAVLGEAFRAEDTITFSFGKIGQFLWPGNEYSGNVHVVPIGITLQSMLGQEPKCRVLTKEDFAALPKREAHSNKGTYGRLLVIAGARDMAGAACLCAKAAYRIGSGLVKVLTPNENRIPLQSYVPEAILCTYDASGCGVVEQLKKELDWADAVVIGPGLGKSDCAYQMVKTVLSFCTKPCLMDADALNLIAEAGGKLDIRTRAMEHLVLTPHMGEMARLTGMGIEEIQANLCEIARSFAKEKDVILVLKDFHTITAVSDETIYCNLFGNPGMATAGSGDVLAGMIGGLLAQKLEPKEAAPLGVACHGYLGDLAAERVGMRGLMAGDLLNGD